MKLRKKLLLSCAALAACATTMVSTTYAWYVVNPTAQANGMTGGTAEASGTTSIYVSKNGTTYAKSVTLGTSDYLGTYSKLDPVTTADGKTFVDVDGDPATTQLIQFVLWIKTSGDATVTPKLTTTNTTATLPTQTAYTNVASNAAAGDPFSVDAVQALRMSVNIIEAADIDAVKADGALATMITAGEVSIHDVQEIDGATGGYTVKTGSVTDETLAQNMDAHEYYKLLMGEEDAATRDFEAAATTAWAAMETEQDTPVCMLFTIWLEGADTLCFDSCVNQTFTFTIDFNATNA